MSLPQPHPDSPPEDDRSIVRYESIQGALGARRTDVAPVDMQPSSSYTYQQQQYPSPVYNALPRMRTPHEHPRTPVGPPPQSYGLPYLSYPPPYTVPSGMPAPSWGTSSYSHHYPESPTDASLSPELVRVDPQPPPPPPPPAPTPDADTKGKQREPPPPRVRASPDYHKLSETYRLILDNTLPSPAAAAAAVPSGLPSSLPSSDVLTRIYECALEGVRQFDPSDANESPPRSPSPHVRPKDEKGPPSKRQRTDAAAESQKCMGCGATSTPEWRRGPLGPRTLCNACGLVYAKLIKKRGRAEAGMSMMEGAAAFATATGAVPGEFIQDYPGSSAHPPPQEPDDDGELPPRAASSAEGDGDGDGDGSEDDSFEEPPQDRR